MLLETKCPTCGDVFTDEIPETIPSIAYTFCLTCREKITDPRMPIHFVKILGERIARLEARVKELEGKKS